MNRKILVLILSSVFFLHLFVFNAAAQVNTGPGFVFQGFLEVDGEPVSGDCRFTFSLFDRAAGGNQLGVTQEVRANVVEGNFTVVLNRNNQFGNNPFNGPARWMEIAAECGNILITQSSRQEILAVPYALGLRPGAAISGSVPFQPVLDIQQTSMRLSDTYALRLQSNANQLALVDADHPLGWYFTMGTGQEPSWDGHYFNIVHHSPPNPDGVVRFSISPFGGVGINTANPDYDLTVLGGGNQIGVVASPSGKTWTMGVGIDENFTISENGQSQLRRLVITEGGNVGIGTNNPSSRLTVNGSFEVSDDDGNLLFVVGTNGDVCIGNC